MNRELAGNLPRLLFLVLFFLITSFSLAQAVPGLMPDEPEYTESDVVVIYGEGFSPAQILYMTVTRPDAVVDGYTRKTDAGGDLVFLYDLNGIQGDYTVNAYATPYTEGDSSLASTVFADKPTFLLSGCGRNRGNCLDGSPYAVGMTGWTTGAVKEYFEGDLIPHRLKISNISAGGDCVTVGSDIECTVDLYHDNFQTAGSIYGFASTDAGSYYIGNIDGTLAYACSTLVGTTPECVYTSETTSATVWGLELKRTVTMTFPSGDIGSTKALFWKAELAAGSSDWSGASLHSRFGSGSRELPVQKPDAPTAVTTPESLVFWNFRLTNNIGTSHTVMAEVFDGYGDPVSGINVYFDITGAHTQSGWGGSDGSGCGTFQTDGVGRVDFTWTGSVAGTDDITVTVDADSNCDLTGETLIETGTKTWMLASTIDLVLSGSDTDGEVYWRDGAGAASTQEVTSTVYDQFGNPMPGVTVYFEVTGANPGSGSSSTDAFGQATYTWSGTVAGTDFVTAYADSDADSIYKEGGEPASSTLNVEWVKASSISYSPSPGSSFLNVDLAITGTVENSDSTNTSMAGLDVSCSATASSVVSGPSQVDSSGQFTLILDGTTAGADTLTCTVDGNRDGDYIDFDDPIRNNSIFWQTLNSVSIGQVSMESFYSNNHSILIDVIDSNSDPVEGISVYCNASSALEGVDDVGGWSDSTTNTSGNTTFTWSRDNDGVYNMITDTVTCYADASSDGTLLSGAYVNDPINDATSNSLNMNWILCSLLNTYTTIDGDVEITPNALVPATLTFDQVTIAGCTVVLENDNGPELPVRTRFVKSDFNYINITSTAVFDTTGKNGYEVVITYDDSELRGNQEDAVKLWHYHDGSWRDITISVNQAANKITGRYNQFSEFAVLVDIDRTPVTTKYFRAIPAGDSMLIEWSTASEIENEGFNILRSTNPEGPFVAVNDKIIWTRGVFAGGADYSFVDSMVAEGIKYYYRLEDIDSHGILHRGYLVSAVAGRPDSQVATAESLAPGQLDVTPVSLSTSDTLVSSTGSGAPMRIVSSYINFTDSVAVDSSEQQSDVYGVLNFEISRSSVGLMIKWSTASDLNIIGFNLLKSDMEDGQYLQINEEMIEPAGDGGESRYSYLDNEGRSGSAYYKLEILRNDGSVIGPVSMLEIRE